MSWTHHPVYTKRLWLWIVDAQRGRRVALGIAELDPDIPEAALEYIQVLPAHRRRGLGAALVNELLARAHSQVAFTTVSGELANPWNPAALYRHCGFTGDDVWWVLRR